MPDLRSGRVALASRQRSGNTWLRYMLEECTGLESGSVYRDSVLRRGAEGVVIKTHKASAEGFDGAVHLVRNPFDSLASFFHFKHDHRNQTWEWDEFIRTYAPRWSKHTNYWLDRDLPKILVRYEDLHASTADELARVLDWLGYEVARDRLVEVAERSTIENMRALPGKRTDTFFRRGETGRGIEEFPPPSIDYMVATVGYDMWRLGYQLPESPALPGSGLPPVSLRAEKATE